MWCNEEQLKVELNRSKELDLEQDLIDPDNSTRQTISIFHYPSSSFSTTTIPQENTLIGNFYLIVNSLDWKELDVTISVYVGSSLLHVSQLKDNHMLWELTGREVIMEEDVTKIPLFWCDLLPHQLFPLYSNANLLIRLYSTDIDQFQIQYDSYPNTGL